MQLSFLTLQCLTAHRLFEKQGTPIKVVCLSVQMKKKKINEFKEKSHSNHNAVVWINMLSLYVYATVLLVFMKRGLRVCAWHLKITLCSGGLLKLFLLKKFCAHFIIISFDHKFYFTSFHFHLQLKIIIFTPFLSSSSPKLQ